MTTYGEHKQFINLGQEPSLEKIQQYNKEVGTSAKIPTVAVEGTQIGYEHSGIVMTDMWVMVASKVKMCRYTTIGDIADTGEELYDPVYKVYKYYGNGNHSELEKYENTKGHEYIMIKGKRLYLDQLVGAVVAHPSNFEWDYHYHYGEKPVLEVEEITEEEKEEKEDHVNIHRGVLMGLIEKNQMIYNKNIELSIALMKTTAVLEDLLNV